MPPAAPGPEGAFLLGDAEVLHVLRARRDTGSTPGARRDPHRVALVVGGGGMRGAYTAGMLKVLAAEGLAPAFDEVYGTSSGAIAAAAFVTGSAAECARCFPEDLATRAFIDLRRLGRRPPAVALDHLFGVLTTVKPMDWSALGATATRLHVVATDAADLSPHLLTGMAGPDTWRTALRASATIPLLAGPPVAYGGRRWVDGSVGEPLAVVRALRAGATHVLALLCRSRTELAENGETRLSPWARALDRVVPGLGTVAQGSRRYGTDLGLVADAAHPDRAGAHLMAVGPSATTGMGALCVDAGPVGESVQIGERSMAAALRPGRGDGTADPLAS